MRKGSPSYIKKHTIGRPGSKGRFDAVLQTRVNRTTLATLAKLFVKKGIVFGSLSDLGRKGLEYAMGQAIARDDAEEVKSIEEANYILESCNMSISVLNTSEQAQRTYQEKLKRESLGFDPEGGVGEPREISAPGASRAIHGGTISDDEMRATAAEIMKQMGLKMNPSD